jgi:hypothetical protein
MYISHKKTEPGYSQKWVLLTYSDHTFRTMNNINDLSDAGVVKKLSLADLAKISRLRHS